MRRILFGLIMIATIGLTACTEEVKLVEVVAVSFDDYVEPKEELVFDLNHSIVDSSLTNKWMPNKANIYIDPPLDIIYYFTTTRQLKVKALTAFPPGQEFSISLEPSILDDEKKLEFVTLLPYTFSVGTNFIRSLTANWIDGKGQNFKSMVRANLGIKSAVDLEIINEKMQVFVNDKQTPFKINNNKASKKIEIECFIFRNEQNLKFQLNFLEGFTTRDSLYVLSEDYKFDSLILINKEEANYYKPTVKKNSISTSGGETQIITDEVSQQEINALQKIEEKIKAGEGNAALLFMKANSLTRMGKFEEAVKTFDDLILNERPNPDYHSNQAVALNALKKYKESVKTLNIALKIDPSLVRALLNRGFAYMGLQEFGKAEADFIKALSLDPSNPLVHNNLAYTYLCLNNPPLCLKHLKLSERYDNLNSWLYRNKACYYAGLNKKELCLENLKKAVELGYKDKAWILEEVYLSRFKNDAEFKKILDSI